MTFRGYGALTALGPVTKREIMPRARLLSHCLPHPLHLETEIRRERSLQKEDSKIRNKPWTMEAPQLQSPQEHRDGSHLWTQSSAVFGLRILNLTSAA